MVGTLVEAFNSLSISAACGSQTQKKASVSVNCLLSSGSQFLGCSDSLRAKFSQKVSVARPVVMAAASTEAESKEVDEDKSARALLRGLRMSHSKVRRVVNQIRGRTYEEALMILEFMPYRACEPVMEVVTSAATNAVNVLGYSKAELFISAAWVNQGSTMKRFRAGPKGRGMSIRKRTCHVEIIVKRKPQE